MTWIASDNEKLHVFFISNTFISKAGLKLAKNQAKAKQHPQTKIICFVHLRYHPKIIGQTLKYLQINKCVCFSDILITNPIDTTKIDLDLDKDDMCLGMIILICNRQHVNIWSSIQLSNIDLNIDLKKMLLIENV